MMFKAFFLVVIQPCISRSSQGQRKNFIQERWGWVSGWFDLLGWLHLLVLLPKPTHSGKNYQDWFITI